MLSASDQSDGVGADQSATSLQQPRSDLQQSTSQGNGSSSPQTTPSISQDQLNAQSLRVGSSAHTVQNTTSTAPVLTYGHNYFNAAWLWLLIPIALSVAVFWPQKKATSDVAGDAGKQTPKAAPMAAPSAPNEQTTTVAPKKAKKKKSKSKKK
jgi:hypothetical protein